MQVKTIVKMRSKEFRNTYGIIAEFYLAGSGISNTFSAKRKYYNSFSDLELEKIPSMIAQAKRWYRTNPEVIEIQAEDVHLWVKLANYCYKAWR